MTNSPDSRRGVGLRGEELAAEHLQRAGLTIIERNWRCRSGEIDVVARHDEWLVFVEVRTRRARARADGSGAPYLGTPEESVTPAKQRQLARMAEEYLFAHPWQGPWRIDVVAIELDGAGSVVRLHHIEDAIQG